MDSDRPIVGFIALVQCTRCEGTGRTQKRACSKCGGRGTIQTEVSVSEVAALMIVQPQPNQIS